jgi:hydroxyethylthiazole kinase
MSQHKAILESVRETHPLVHHITNYVTVNDCANITLCIGGSPVMAHAHAEVADMVEISNALVLNIGTLDPYQVESMYLAAEAAEVRDIPIILDPVGAGATPYRTEVAKDILYEFPIAVVKGNAGEIGTLAGMQAEVKGVDSAGISGDPLSAVKHLAETQGAIVAMSGSTDIISDGDRVILVKNGSPLMGMISGTGCMAASLIGSCAGVTPDYLAATTTALCAFGIAGEHAALHVDGPFSFKMSLFDALYNLKPEALVSEGKIELCDFQSDCIVV